MKLRFVSRKIVVAMMCLVAVVSGCGTQNDTPSQSASSEPSPSPAATPSTFHSAPEGEPSDEPELFEWDEPGAEEEDEALVYDEEMLEDVTLFGTVFTFRGEHPNGEEIQAVGLRLQQPITIDTAFTGKTEVTEVQLVASAQYGDGDDAGPELFDGLLVAARGEAFGAHTAWHLRDLVLLTDEIQVAPEPEEAGYQFQFGNTIIYDFPYSYNLSVDHREDAFRLLSGTWYTEQAARTIDASAEREILSDGDVVFTFGADGTVSFTDEDGQTTKLQAAFHTGEPDGETAHILWPDYWYVELTGHPYGDDSRVYLTLLGQYLYVYITSESKPHLQYVMRRTAKADETTGTNTRITKDMQKELNLFLSNFVEQGAFSAWNGTPRPEELLRFAMTFAKINSPEKVTQEGDFEFLKVTDCNEILARYTPYIIPSAEEPFLENNDPNNDDPDLIWVFGGNVIRAAADGEAYSYIAVANALHHVRDDVYKVDYDVYELDIVEYMEQGIDDAYYEMSAAEAKENPALTLSGGGHAVVESITDGTRNSYRLLENENYKTVSTAAELLRAIASNRIIELTGGTYNLTKELDKGRLPEAYEDGGLDGEGLFSREVYDGKELVLGAIHDLTLRAATSDGVPEHVEILCEPRYADVISFQDCRNITLSGLTMGHTNEGYCAGDVLQFYFCDGVLLDQMDLYGCGTYGLSLNNVYDLEMKDSVVRDCSYGCIDAMESYYLQFENTVFRDCREFTMLGFSSSGASFTDCKFYRLHGDLVSASEDGYIFFERCLYDEDALQSLKTNGQVRKTITVE